MSGADSISTRNIGATTKTSSPADDQPIDQPNWWAALHSTGPDRTVALAHLHELLIRGARHQISRMRSQLGPADATTIDALINSSADEAMMSVLRRLNSFAGRSKFSTWAYKFAIMQATSDVRRFQWRDRDVDLADIQLVDPGSSPEQIAVASDLGRALNTAIRTALTPHQRRVAIALLIDGVPIDVLAERLGSTRGALYKTLHDVRVRLRHDLTSRGYLSDPRSSESPTTAEASE